MKDKKQFLHPDYNKYSKEPTDSPNFLAVAIIITIILILMSWMD